MAQQTAVSWLISQIGQYLEMNIKEAINIIEQAKQMEKEQIIDAFWNGDNSDCTSEQNTKDFAEQYYNETYNK